MKQSAYAIHRCKELNISPALHKEVIDSKEAQEELGLYRLLKAIKGGK